MLFVLSLGTAQRPPDGASFVRPAARYLRKGESLPSNNRGRARLPSKKRIKLLIAAVGNCYALSGLTSVSAAVVSQAGMDGVDGSWAVLSGPNPVAPDTLTLRADEDRMADYEQGHTTEQVAYIVFR